MLSASTRLAAVIGSPVRHSLSPLLHNTAFGALGLDWVYLAFEIDEPDVGIVLDAMRTLDWGGLSVTMPAKEAVARQVDRLSADAEALGAVNCVARDGDQLIGHNTDGAGFVDCVRLDHGIDPSGLSCAVVGAGGAARAVVRALADSGAAEVIVVSRTPERAEAAADLAGAVGRVAGPDAVSGADLVVNATPLGMGGDPTLPVDPTLLHPGQLVVDLVYHPLETPLVAAARAQGVPAANGVGMLVHQAGRQLRIWTGLEPPLEAMQAAVVGAIGAS